MVGPRLLVGVVDWDLSKMGSTGTRNVTNALMLPEILSGDGLVGGIGGRSVGSGRQVLAARAAARLTRTADAPVEPAAAGCDNGEIEGVFTHKKGRRRPSPSPPSTPGAASLGPVFPPGRQQL